MLVVLGGDPAEVEDPVPLRAEDTEVRIGEGIPVTVKLTDVDEGDVPYGMIVTLPESDEGSEDEAVNVNWYPDDDELVAPVLEDADESWLVGVKKTVNDDRDVVEVTTVVEKPVVVQVDDEDPEPSVVEVLPGPV